MDTESESIRVICSDLKEYARIELPVFVDDIDSTFAALGAEPAMLDAANNEESPLRFKLSSLPANSSTTTASVVHKNGLLLRVRRSRKNPEDTSCTVLGKVPKSHIFNNLADYKFVPPPGFAASKEILNIPPSSFCREGVNKVAHRLVLQETLSKPSAGKAASAIEGAGEGTGAEMHVDEDGVHNIQETVSRNPDKGMAYFINIDDATPQQHPRGEYPYENERGIVLVKLLKKLFSIIPILSREQIETFINLEGRVHLFKSCLPYVAYNMVKGPYRQMWIRYGYDPKLHPESAIFQTIHFRVSPHVVKDVTDRVGRKVGNSIGRSKMVDLDGQRVSELPLNSVTYLLINRPQEDPPIFVYNHVLKMQFTVQVYQLMDPSIIEYLSSTQLLPSFDYVTGWYPAETMNTLRVMALKVLPERINSFLALPDSVVWEAYHSSGTVAPSSGGDSGAVPEAPASSSGAQAAVAEAVTTPLTGSFDVNEDAATFGFAPHSMGMFVVFNRTMNTVRAYLRHAEADHFGSQSASSGAKSNQSIAAGQLSERGAVGFDALRTVDGISCGKVLAWLRPYSEALRRMQERSALDYSSLLLPSSSSGSGGGFAAGISRAHGTPGVTKPSVRFVAKAPVRAAKSQPIAPSVTGKRLAGDGASGAAATGSARPAARGAASKPAGNVQSAMAFELLEEQSGSSEMETSDSEED